MFLDIIKQLEEACDNKLSFFCENDKIYVNESDFSVEELYSLYRKLDAAFYSEDRLFSIRCNLVYYINDNFAFHLLTKKLEQEEYIFWTFMADAAEDFVNANKEEFPQTVKYMDMCSVLEK